MDYENLKAAIKQAIKQNGNQEITGNLLQSTLLNIVNTLWMSQKAVSDKLSDLNSVAAISLGDTDSNLDIADENGNVLARFSDGHIKTKDFNSVNVPSQMDNEETDADLLLSDNNGNALAEFKGGHFRTKEFNSRIVPSQDAVDDTDLDISDPQGNVVLRLKGGHIQTKNFFSQNVIGAKVINKDGKNILVFN